jgi:hypothetical protein
MLRKNFKAMDPGFLHNTFRRTNWIKPRSLILESIASIVRKNALESITKGIEWISFPYLVKCGAPDTRPEVFIIIVDWIW